MKTELRKFNIEDDQDNHIKNLQKRIDTLEDDTEKMKSKFEKVTECYLNLRKALIDHLQTLKDNSDTAEVKSQMERLRELLDLICNDMLLNLPGDSAEAENQLKQIQNLCGQLQNHKDDVIKTTSETRSKSQNMNIPEEEVKTLHQTASELEDKLHGTSYQLAEREKIHSNIFNLLKDFEKREAALQQFLNDVTKSIDSVKPEVESTTGSDVTELTKKFAKMSELSKLLEGDKKADLKLFEMSKEKYQAAANELLALGGRSDSQSSSDDIVAIPQIESRYDTLKGNYDDSSENVSSTLEELKRLIENWKNFETCKKHCSDWVTVMSKRMDNFPSPWTESNKLNDQIIDIKTAKVGFHSVNLRTLVFRSIFGAYFFILSK